MTDVELEGLLRIAAIRIEERLRKCPYRLDRDDLRSRANIALAEAIASYDTDAGASLKTWCETALRVALHAEATQARRDWRRQKSLPDDLEDRGRFSLDAMLGEIDDDAATLVMLVIDPPFPVKKAAKLSTLPYSPEGALSRLLEWLRGMGWGHDRIHAAVSQVREALA